MLRDRNRTGDHLGFFLDKALNRSCLAPPKASPGKFSKIYNFKLLLWQYIKMQWDTGRPVRGHSNSAHAGLGGGGVIKMRANACMGEGGSQGHACARLGLSLDW